MPDRFARCLNIDYCWLGSNRLLLRLEAHEPFFCPECAHPLDVALAPRDGPRMSWQAMAAVALGVLALGGGLALTHRGRVPTPVAAPRAVVAVPHLVRRMPAVATASPAPVPAEITDPDALWLAASTDAVMLGTDGHVRVPRQRRQRGPTNDPVAVAALGNLSDGIPGAPWPASERPGRAVMPWRQALIMAALMAAPDVSMPEAAADSADAATPAARDVAGQTRNGAAAALPPGAAQKLQTAMLEAITMPRPEAPGAAAPLGTVPPSAAAAAAKTRAQLAIERRLRYAAWMKALAARKAAAAAAAAKAAPAAGATRIDATDTDQPAPHPRVVVLPADAKFTYGPLHDVNIPTQPTKVFFNPARPTADKPGRGKLQVNCAIETTGVPSDCHVLHAEKAAEVTDVILGWLGSGAMRYRPALQDGKPIRSRRTFWVDFPSEAQR